MKSQPVVLFLHIPKTGGKTLDYCIYSEWCFDVSATGEEEPLYPGAYMFHDGIYWFPAGFFKPPDLSMPDRVSRALERSDIRAVLGHFWFGIHRHLNRPATYITLLREPVERVVSLYYHLKEYSDPQPLPREGMSLHEFVTTAPFREVDNDQTRRISGLEPGVGKCTRLTLERAKENLRRHFTVVGTTERFDETLLLLKRSFGWSDNLHYYPKNRNLGRPPVSSLPRETVQAVRERNELDAELHRFADELLNAAVSAQGASYHEELESFRSMQRERGVRWVPPAKGRLVEPQAIAGPFDKGRAEV